MNLEHRSLLQRLVELGWTVTELPCRKPLPAHVVARYPTIPLDYKELVESLGLVASPDDTAWLVTSCVFSEGSGAYAWNEWEQQSLAACGSDETLLSSVRAFWDRHLPVLMSVKSGYVHVSLDLETLGLVQGEEPEYEETSPLASSMTEFLQLIVNGDLRVRRWV